MKRVILLLSVALVLSSCSIFKHYSVEQAYSEVWKGKSYTEIVVNFGAPDRVESDGNGGQILVYEKFSTKTTTEVDTHFGYFDPDYTTKVQRERLFTHFFIGSDNVCYHIRSNEVRMDPKGQRNIRIIAQSYIGALGIIAIMVPFMIGF